MSGAKIVINQPTAPGPLPAGKAGVSRRDLVLGFPVSFTNDDDTGVRSWRWRLIDKPFGSNAFLSNPVDPNPTITPDVAGSYLVELIVDEGRAGQVSRVVGAVLTDLDGAFSKQIRIPAAEEDDEANWSYQLGATPTPNEKGWWPDLWEIMLETIGLAETSARKIRAIDISQLDGVQAAYDFEDDLTDRSGNGLTLSLVSPAQFATIDGKRCAYRELGSQWGRSSHDANLAITGALTVHQLVYPFESRPADNSYLYSFSTSGENEADNFLFGLKVKATATTWRLAYLHESGAGTDREHDFEVQYPIAGWRLITLVRNAAGTGVTLYLDGEPAGQVGTLAAAPSGGTNAKLRLWADGFSVSTVLSYVGDFVVQDVAMTADEVRAVARQVGVAPI